jgi:hypothetical protein
MTQQSSVSTSNRFSALNEVTEETQQKKALSYPKKDNEDRPIPTVVNGVIWVKNNKKTDQKYNDYTESSIKEKEKSKKHRIPLLGDSQARGCADLLKLELNSEIDVSRFVKPGAEASDILGTNIDKDMSLIL